MTISSRSAVSRNPPLDIDAFEIVMLKFISRGHVCHVRDLFQFCLKDQPNNFSPVNLTEPHFHENFILGNF